MFVRSANSRTDTMMAMKMMMPPIVGVPFFCICPSSPRSLISSPICFFCSHLMIRFPMISDMTMAVTLAIMALKVR